MHDSRGAMLKVGDRVLIEAEIIDLQPRADPNYCNVTVNAITPDQIAPTPMAPPSHMVFNTKMLTKVGAGRPEDTMVSDPGGSVWIHEDYLSQRGEQPSPTSVVAASSD